jgi:hypothetical protein
LGALLFPLFLPFAFVDDDEEELLAPDDVNVPPSEHATRTRQSTARIATIRARGMRIRG